MRSRTLVNFRHDIFAIDKHGLIGTVAQSRMQNRPVLGDINRLAGEHVLDGLRQAGVFCQLDQQRYRLLGDQILGIIQK